MWEKAVMSDKIYIRINFLVFVSYITSWRDCFGLSNDCIGFGKHVMVSVVYLQKKILKIWDWSGIRLELPLLISCEI